ASRWGWPATSSGATPCPSRCARACRPSSRSRRSWDGCKTLEMRGKHAAFQRRTPQPSCVRGPRCGNILVITLALSCPRDRDATAEESVASRDITYRCTDGGREPEERRLAGRPGSGRKSMNAAELLQRLHQHRAWVNGNLLTAAASLGDEK